jgi:hypothetical protein
MNVSLPAVSPVLAYLRQKTLAFILIGDYYRAAPDW